jgi:parallel beta-helix repeat protein
VHCGQTLTHSVKLANDLTNCPGDGLVIGADGITVDLNRHTIDGVPRQGCDLPDVKLGGVQNDAGYDDVRVTGGTVQEFDIGVAAEGSSTTGMSDSRVDDLILSSNRISGVTIASPAARDNQVDHNLVSGHQCGAGVFVAGGRGNRIAHNRVQDGAQGVVLGNGAEANMVESNSVSDVSDDGIAVFDSGATHIERNVVTDTGDYGIWNGGRSSKAIITDNAVARTRNTGIMVECDCGDAPDVPTEVRVSGNTVSATGSGIWLIDTDRDVVTRNTVTGAGTFGGPRDFGVGVLLHGVSDTRVSRNTVTDGSAGIYGIAPGIVIGLPPGFNPSSRPVSGNVVERNSVSDQEADGIFIGLRAQDTTLERNTADRNGKDGIYVLSPSTTITRNTADNNAAYGIEAIPAAIDGGHNQAAGNGNTEQCTGVACS